MEPNTTQLFKKDVSLCWQSNVSDVVFIERIPAGDRYTLHTCTVTGDPASFIHSALFSHDSLFIVYLEGLGLLHNFLL
jgi:rRNA maturation protein Nop10